MRNSFIFDFVLWRAGGPTGERAVDEGVGVWADGGGNLNASTSRRGAEHTGAQADGQSKERAPVLNFKPTR